MTKTIVSTKSVSTKAKRAPRSSTKAAKTAQAAPALVLNHTEFVEVDAGDMALNDLIASLSAPDEIIETPIRASAKIDDDVLNAAVSGAEATEIMVNAATPSGVIEGGEPTGDATDVVDAPEKAAKTPKEPKAPGLPRKHYTDKTERLKDKLGAGLSEYSILTLADAGVSDEELVTKMEETMVLIKAMNKKKATRAVLLIEFLAGKSARLNEVIHRAANIVARDGCITTGNEGNLYKDLLARPYSAGAARAMGGNTVSMMADLKLLTLDGKGKYVPNPDSLLLMKLQSMVTSTIPTRGADAVAS